MTMIAPGSRVRHAGTRQFGTVLQAVPQRDGTFEYEVQRDGPLWPGETTWWASYRTEPVAENETREGNRYHLDHCAVCGRPANNGVCPVPHELPMAEGGLE